MVIQEDNGASNPTLGDGLKCVTSQGDVPGVCSSFTIVFDWDTLKQDIRNQVNAVQSLPYLQVGFLLSVTKAMNCFGSFTLFPKKSYTAVRRRNDTFSMNSLPTVKRKISCARL